MAGIKDFRNPFGVDIRPDESGDAANSDASCGRNTYGEFVPGWVWMSRLSGIASRLDAIARAGNRSEFMAGDPVSSELRAITCDLESLCTEWDADLIAAIRQAGVRGAVSVIPCPDNAQGSVVFRFLEENSLEVRK